MKKQLLKIAVLAAVAIGISGCRTSTYTNGIYIPTDSIKKQNSSTKVYFEDQSLATIKHNLQNIADYLNTNSIVPKTICKTSKVNVKKDKEFYKDIKCSENTSNEQINLKFKVDATNYITTDKVYNNDTEVFNDFLIIEGFLNQELTKKPELREKLGTSASIYYDVERLMNEKKLAFTIQREIVRDAISDILNIQMNNAGWQIVNNKESADRVYLFDLTRDFTLDEAKEMRNKNTIMKINIFSNSNEPISMNANKITGGFFYYATATPIATKGAPKPISTLSSNNFASNAVLGDSAMRIASSTNSSGSSAAVGVGAAVGASALDFLFSSKPNFTFVLPFMKEIDTSSKKSLLRFYSYGIFMGNTQERKSLAARVNNSNVEQFIEFKTTPLN